ncbi:amidase signature domain-containing protein [Chaetomium strumarium]|uniref:Glutamyl-tRNA(Gln) amidotransferase subunit A, mitochondrial n=1 Tax=Chaetomium strumarium TaxID=1170767 RepID=A0AAJ0H3D2_9PEZI|nr:amidase signature domain-containing protein [Chaetomium strumarium]
MSARGRPRGLHLRHGCLSRQQQLRLLNHFISKAPQPTGQPIPSHFTLAVKDNIATTSALHPSPSSDPPPPALAAAAALPTTCASPFLSTYRSPFEATIVAQLRARGARLVGKTNLDEFGMGSHSTHSAFGAVSQQPSQPPQPQPSQPSQPESAASLLSSLLSAGGSSGGSAVAVAAGEADVALGTDTGGSVRLPAAYCGVVGFKPSYGMLSRFGVVPYANSLDTVGLLAGGVGRIRELIVGGGGGEEGGDNQGLWGEWDEKDPTSLSLSARRRCAREREGYYYPRLEQEREVGEVLRTVTFGIPLEYNIEELDPRIRDGWAKVAKTLQHEFGARVVPVSLPSTRHALSAYYVIAPAEASSNLAKYDGIRYGTRDTDSASDAAGGVLYAASRGRGFGDEVKRRILLGSYTLSSEAMDNYFIKAQRVRRLVRRDFDRVFALDNPLHEKETFDLADLDESIAMEDKWGPEEVDFLLCPTAPTLAPKLGDVMNQTPVDAYMNDVFTVPASLAGLPAISIPMPLSETAGDRTRRSDTAGLQLIGQYWDDARLLAVADAIFKTIETTTSTR